MGFEPTTFCMASRTYGSGSERISPANARVHVCSVVLRFPGFDREFTGVWVPNGYPDGCESVAPRRWRRRAGRQAAAWELLAARLGARAALLPARPWSDLRGLMGLSSSSSVSLGLRVCESRAARQAVSGTRRENGFRCRTVRVGLRASRRVIGSQSRARSARRPSSHAGCDHAPGPVRALGQPLGGTRRGRNPHGWGHPAALARVGHPPPDD
jgi:hypothetical protein